MIGTHGGGAGPLDISGAARTGRHGGRDLIGAVNDDLAAAIAIALRGAPAACVAEAQHYRWENCTDAFEAGLAAASADESLLAA